MLAGTGPLQSVKGGLLPVESDTATVWPPHGAWKPGALEVMLLGLLVPAVLVP